VNMLMKGFSREYDLTCCESEAATHGIPVSIGLTKARNILLFSLLLDGQEEGAYPKLWSVFHDFTIDVDAVNMIRVQTEKLIRISESVESWRDSPYGDILRIVNLETFRVIRDVWLKYDNPKTSERVFIEQFKSAHTRISRKYQNEAEKFTTAAFTRSFGVQGMGASYVSSNYMLQFWKTGIADLQTRPNAVCNPLFAYSSADIGPKFAVHFSTSPLAVYHLGTALVDLTPDSIFYQGRYVNKAHAADQPKVAKNTKRVVECAKLQFDAWCNAFQQLVKTSRNSIILRFIVADTISYCYALQNRADEEVGLPTFSSTWSGTPLYLDGDNNSMFVHNNPPVKYNVIDTASTFLDRAGGINFLVAAVPLIKQSPESTIHTETIAPRWSEETNIFLNMLGALDAKRGDVTIMCNVFGVAPLSYLTGCTTRGLMQDLPTILDFSGERPSPILHHVVWKIPALGDSKILNLMNVVFQPQDFVKPLMFACTRMFARQPGSTSLADDDRTTLYTVRGFVTFLAFLKRRIIVTDWNLAMEMFLTSFGPRPDYGYSLTDLQTQMCLMGVYTPTQLHFTVDRILNNFANLELSSQRHSRGVLSLADPPPSICVVLSVPRTRLRQIYDTCFKQSVDFDVRFNVRLHYSAFDDVYSSPIPIFGKLEVSEDGKSCDVETDKEGWHGSSDLHVFLSLETHALLRESPKNLFVSFNIVATTGCTTMFRDTYGSKLQIFKTSLLGDKVQLVNSVNSHRIQVAENISGPSDKLITVDGRYTQTHPKLYMKDGIAWFSTVITLLNEEDRAVLASGAKLSQQIQARPCVVFINYGNVQHICQFPFPISCRSSIIKISKQHGYIDYSAPLSSGAQRQPGGYSTHFLSLSCEIGTSVFSSWNLPTINFSRLPRINDTVLPSSSAALSAPPQMFLDHMFSDDDHGRDRRPSRSVLYNFKRTLYEFFSHIFGLEHDRHQIFALRHGKGEIELMFFLMGLYVDPSSSSLVADTYLAQMTPHLAERYNFSGKTLFNMDMMIVEVNTEELEVIRNALPAMVERCRDWEHTSECEYITGPSPKTADGRSYTCSCGMGKVNAEFEKNKEWMGHKPFVIRCAVSPLFPAPYVEQTRLATLDLMGRGMEAAQQIPPSPLDAMVAPFDNDLGKICEVCRKNGNAKKCAACENVFYCSKECQKKDWKRHKGVCTVRARARAG
jgi:MYND finger